MKKLFLFLVFVLLVLIGVGYAYWQRNSISRELLELEILGADKATLGEEVIYTVKWKNSGEVRLENVEMIFEYPEGSVPTEDTYVRVVKRLEDINPKEEKSMRFGARLFGKEGDVKEVRVSLSYTPKNISARLHAETSTSTLISLVPLNFELDLPSRVESGQEVEFVLNYFSNSEYPLSNLRIKLEYPQGFEFVSATPEPIGDREWNVGVLNRGDGYRIVVRGVLGGEVQETKIFKATLGSWNDGKFVLMKEVTRAAQITKPRLFVSQVINSSPDYIATLQDTLHYEIFFKNLSDRVLENLFLIVSFDGRAFDLESVKLDRGKLQKGDNSIIWEARDVTKLRFLGKGEEGKVEFWINLKDEIEMLSPQDKNPLLKNRVLLSDVTKEFEIKLNSRLAVDQKGFFQDEVFGNQGLIPPKVAEKTTYTIIWQARNGHNDVQNVRVKAVLPQGVELTGNIAPADAPLTFDSGSREVVWNVGDLQAGTGLHAELPAPSVAFQVAFTPTSSQRRSKPQIIGEAKIVGDDMFTEQVVSFVDDPIDTTLPDDDSVSDDQGVVQ